MHNKISRKKALASLEDKIVCRVKNKEIEAILFSTGQVLVQDDCEGATNWNFREGQGFTSTKTFSKMIKGNEIPDYFDKGIALLKNKSYSPCQRWYPELKSFIDDIDSAFSRSNLGFLIPQFFNQFPYDLEAGKKRLKNRLIPRNLALKSNKPIVMLDFGGYLVYDGNVEIGHKYLKSLFLINRVEHDLNTFSSVRINIFNPQTTKDIRECVRETKKRANKEDYIFQIWPEIEKDSSIRERCFFQYLTVNHPKNMYWERKLTEDEKIYEFAQENNLPYTKVFLPAEDKLMRTLEQVAPLNLRDATKLQ